MRIFFMGAPGRVRGPRETDLPTALSRTGNNTGNLLIGASVRRQLVYESSGEDLSLDPRQVEASFDVVVICAANFISENVDLSVLASFLESVRLPCVMIGVGAQLPNYQPDPIKLRPGTRRFLEIVSERSKLIGARGCFSAQVLEKLGITNVEVIGCPSIYWNPRRELYFHLPQFCENIRVCVNGTRHAGMRAGGGLLRQIETHLVRDAIELGGSFVCQDELEEMCFAGGIIPSGHFFADAFANYYSPVIDRNVVSTFFRRSCYTFFDVGSWAEFIAHFDFVCGSRLHGCMIALQNEVPAHFIAHDSRLREVCELLEVPHTWIGDSNGEFSIERAYAEIDLAPFTVKRATLFDRYKTFLEVNGLHHRLSGGP